MKTCFWLGVGAGFGSVILCELSNQFLRMSCEEEKFADYLRDLAGSGCPPKPAGSNDTSTTPVLSEAKTLEAAAD